MQTLNFVAKQCYKIRGPLGQPTGPIPRTNSNPGKTKFVSSQGPGAYLTAHIHNNNNKNLDDSVDFWYTIWTSHLTSISSPQGEQGTRSPCLGARTTSF